MNKFPVPPPDRRLIERRSVEDNRDHKSFNIEEKPNKSLNIYKDNDTNHSSSKIKNRSVNVNNTRNNINTYGDLFEKEDYEKTNNLNILKIKHIEDMRNNILNYKILNEKKMFLSSTINNLNLNSCNIILFGPSGSGKSSFIKTLYRSVYGTSILPPEAINKLIIKETDENEGTICFTRLHLKEESNLTSGIVVCDTRGHILMNEIEKEQFKVIIKGNIKENVEIKQIQNRNPILFWEFWKKDSEIFPKEIFFAKEVGIESIPHSIVLVFDGSRDEIIDRDDINFYKELIGLSLKKGIL